MSRWWYGTEFPLPKAEVIGIKQKVMDNGDIAAGAAIG
jgi:hypothetical protein